MGDYLSIARQVLERAGDREKSEVCEERWFPGSVSSLHSHNSRPSVREGLLSCVAGLNVSDRATWPPYLRRLEDVTSAQFGGEVARLQVESEIAFLRNAAEQGWVILGWGALGSQKDVS